MANKGEQEPRTTGKEEKKRKQATGAEGAEESHTAGKKMKLDEERGTKGEESGEQVQVCDEENDGVEVCGSAGTIQSDGCGDVFSSLFKKKPYENRVYYTKDQVYKGYREVTDDEKSFFQLDVKVSQEKVSLYLVLKPIPENPPPLSPYQFQVTLVREGDKDMWGCPMETTSSQEKEIEDTYVLEFLRQKCREGKEIIFRVVEKTVN